LSKASTPGLEAERIAGAGSSRGLLGIAIVCGLLWGCRAAGASVNGPEQSKVWLACTGSTKITKSFFYTPEAQDQHLKCYLDHSCKQWIADSGEESDAGAGFNYVYVIDSAKKKAWIRQANGQWSSLTSNPGFSISATEIRLWDEQGESVGNGHSNHKDYLRESIDLKTQTYRLRQVQWESSSNQDRHTETRGTGSCAWITPVVPVNSASAETTAFDSALRARTSAAYHDYLTHFPGGQHTKDIQRRLNQCKVLKEFVAASRQEPMEVSAYGVPDHDVSPVRENSESLRAQCQKSHGGTLDQINNSYHDYEHHSMTITSRSICHWQDTEERLVEECP
jgi:hypothetical protein